MRGEGEKFRAAREFDFEDHFVALFDPNGKRAYLVLGVGTIGRVLPRTCKKSKCGVRYTP
jgi:hypothetical protein